MIRHVEELKKERDGHTDEWEKVRDEAEMWKAENGRGQADLREALQREQELARKLALMEQNYSSQGEQYSTVKDQY